MSWNFTDLTPIVLVRLRNPFLGAIYPTERLALAVLDTGYEGFVLVPLSVFRALRLDELRTTLVPATVADGRRVRFKQAFGSLEIPDLELTEDGPVQTHPGASEILLGMVALRHLVAHINGCSRTLSLEEC